jgi:hypothetical protein
MIAPKDITKDSETQKEFASFGFYDGIHLAKENKWKQVSDFSDLQHNKTFLVCCGDVMIAVKPTDYPELERRII